MDDDQMILEIIAAYFEQQGFRVLTAENGREGLDILHKSPPDIVLVDLNMPVVNGFEVLKEIRKKNPEIPRIVISGEGEMADVIQALHLGAWHYLTKPIESYDIVEHAVEQALEKADLIKQNHAYQDGLENKLATILERFPGYVFTCTPDFRITYANKRLLDYSNRNMLGEPCHKVICGTERVCSWCPIISYTSREMIRQEVENPKNSRWYDTTYLPVLDQGGKVVEYQVVMLDITEQKQRLHEAEERENILRQENSRLLESLADRFRFGNIIGKSKPMQEVYRTILDAAGSEASVVIYGESGTGKELVAQSIHDNSSRKEGPFICVNCGAIPENLIESEFFGYMKGAFSGAAKNKFGYLDIADSGTLFLDEVGDIPLHLQIKLLRAIEGGGFTPLGGTEIKKPDVRIISATNKDLTQLVKQGQMRQDFLYRIHVIPVHLPPLRDRKEDIRLLIDHFFELYDQENSKSLPSNIRKSLLSHPWPGNVRELQNTIHRFVTLGKLDFLMLEPDDIMQDNTSLLPEISDETHSLPETMDHLEKQVIIRIFEKNNWHQSRTANALKIDRKTLYRKMKQHEIEKPG